MTNQMIEGNVMCHDRRACPVEIKDLKNFRKARWSPIDERDFVARAELV
jgi:hypothetical protein